MTLRNRALEDRPYKAPGAESSAVENPGPVLPAVGEELVVTVCNYYKVIIQRKEGINCISNPHNIQDETEISILNNLSNIPCTY